MQAGQVGGGFAPVPPPQPRRGPNVGLIVGMLFLLLVLVGGGIFALTRLNPGGKSNTNTSTPTVHSTTGTTPSPAITPTPKPLFSDNFANNDSGWSVGTGSGFSHVIENNMLTMADSNHKILIESVPTNTIDNFTVTATVTLLQGDQNDSVGIYMRGDSNLDHDYRVDVFGDGTYSIAKEYLDSNNTPRVSFLVDPSSSSALKPTGQENKIMVIMKGTQIVLLINDTVVRSITDSTYTSKGQVALFVQNGTTSSGVKAAFSGITISAAPDQLPS